MSMGKAEIPGVSGIAAWITGQFFLFQWLSAQPLLWLIMHHFILLICLHPLLSFVLTWYNRPGWLGLKNTKLLAHQFCHGQSASTWLFTVEFHRNYAWLKFCIPELAKQDSKGQGIFLNTSVFLILLDTQSWHLILFPTHQNEDKSNLNKSNITVGHLACSKLLFSQIAHECTFTIHVNHERWMGQWKAPSW